MPLRPDDTAPTSHEATLEANPVADEPSLVRLFQLAVVAPAEGITYRSTGRTVSVGSHPTNDLVLANATVSRFHCELVAGPEGVLVRDLGSRNGTTIDGVRVKEAWLSPGNHLRLGHVTLRYDPSSSAGRVELSSANRFGGLVGESVPMRAAFALLERAAASDATVLLEAETGTGKGAATEALHQLGPRRDRPLVVVDCASVVPGLLDSELFGHEKGAFTGANARRVGAFEEADGGTIFLDEIGELPLELQPKLLRVLENREVRRVGQNAFRKIDVRVVAATNRDLRSAVNDGKMRADLYYRLAVVHVRLPPLRRRLDDLPILVGELLAGLGASPEQRARLETPELLASLRGNAWPGNVRELRNYLERCLVLVEPPALQENAGAATGDEAPIDPSIPLAEARRRNTEGFERRYLQALLRAHDGVIAAAARTAGVARVHLYRMLNKHGIKE